MRASSAIAATLTVQAIIGVGILCTLDPWHRGGNAGRIAAVVGLTLLAFVVGFAVGREAEASSR